MSKSSEILRLHRHACYEDVLAILTGTLFVALGMLIYSESALLVGGLIGMALLAQYVTGLEFWLIFFLLNLPFYLLAVRSLGWRFALRTLAAVGLVSLFSLLMASWVEFSHLDPVYAAVVGGALCGTGLLVLFRHGAGLGGVNILAIFLQESYGIRAGYFQLGVVLTILAAAFCVLSLDGLLLSVAGAAVLTSFSPSTTGRAGTSDSPEARKEEL